MTAVLLYLVVKFALVACVFAVAVIFTKGHWWKRLLVAIIVAVMSYFLLDIPLLKLWRYVISTFAANPIK